MPLLVKLEANEMSTVRTLADTWRTNRVYFLKLYLSMIIGQEKILGTNQDIQGKTRKQSLW